MKLTVPTLVASVVVAALLGFFIGRSTATPSKKSSNEISSNEEKKEEKKEKSADKKEEENKAKEVKKEEGTTKEVTEVDSIESRDPDPITEPTLASGGVIHPRINMGISDKKISEILSEISKNLEKKKLAYVSNLSQDCSGIYHQLKDSIQKRLPALAAGPTYQYPIYNKDRSSRQIADWYFKNGNLTIVEDPVASKNSIRPGSVMFFGKPNKKYSNMDIDMLTDRKNNYTSNGAIMHIAVVTQVTTDENGDIVDYTMMHGRNPRRHASRTGSKEVQSRNTKGLPPFGNWSQQWVAVANIATAK